MTETDALNRLAALAGIEDGWWDFFGNWRVVSPETKLAFLAAMGFRVGSDAEVAASLKEFEERPWRRWLEPVAVVREAEGAPVIAITQAEGRDGGALDWSLDEDLGITHGGRVDTGTLPVAEERMIDGVPHRRRLFRLPALPPPGYHRFRLTSDDGAEAWMSLIVAPPRAHQPEHLENGGRVWGVQTQVYALRSAGDWGVGDYSALRDLCAGLGRMGAATVGVNPLHALFGNRPERFSPYSPSSRTFANVIYLDVEAIPDFADCDEARRLVADEGFQRSLSELRGADLVDYQGVGARKRQALDAVYRCFRERHAGGDRGQAFRRYQQETGRAGELFATFEALQEHFLRRDPNLGYWRHWPEEYRRPDSRAVAEFTQAHRDRVEFFWYLQWQVDVQLAAVQNACRNTGMPIGLYRDLGVGIADDGAEAWSQQDQLALGVTIGAPPDPLAPAGQDWGLAPYNPVALREAGYAPFIGVLRANMRHAGALRLDHAMQLQRLYWVPSGNGADQGAYVRFPVADLFAITALESRRNQCLVIGEDLGTVPDGFRDRMFDSGVYGYRLFVFERNHDGAFKRPADFTEQALVAVGTHDLPSLLGYWQGTDVAQRRRLNLYPRPEMADDEERARAEDRRKLVEALRAEGLLDEDFPTGGSLDEARTGRLLEAVHAYLEKAPSRILMTQIEDLLGLVVQFNLPGTTDQHPNWRRRFPVDVAAVLRHPRLHALARRLLDTRCSPEQRMMARLE